MGLTPPRLAIDDRTEQVSGVRMRPDVVETIGEVLPAELADPSRGARIEPVIPGGIPHLLCVTIHQPVPRALVTCRSGGYFRIP